MTQELVRYTAIGTFVGGDIWSNVWHINWPAGSSPLSAADADTIDTQFAAFYSSTMAALCSSKASFVGAIVQDLNTDGLIPWEMSSSVTPTGGTTIPQINACVATLRNSGGLGPSKRGRVFLPMNKAEACGTNGLILGAARQTVVDAVADLADALIANTDSLGITVYSRKLDSYVGVTQVTCDNYVAVQRGRQKSVLRQADTGAVVYNP